MTQLDNIVRGHSLARLIKKHGGWLDENDKEIVRFPTPHAMAMFMRALKRDNMLPKVTKHTRAPNAGRMIYCPKCGNGDRVYHFSWAGGTCQSCWQMVNKEDYYLEPPDKDALPKPLPPVFKQDAGDYWMLYAGDGSYTGIAVEFKGKPGAWGPCDVIDNGYVTQLDSIAGAKSVAMGLLRDRKHG